MELLTDRDWQIKYDADSGSLLNSFYVPALSCAQRYDRTSGYFAAPVLTLAARGVEGLIRNDGRMRLVVSCRLGEEEVAAIERGESLRDTVSRRLEQNPLAAAEPDEVDALELLAWMVARGHLEVKVAVLCGPDRKPIVTGTWLFHEKAGIIEDRVGNRIAFNGSVNETPSGWQGNWESFHVYRDWDGERGHVEAEEEGFGRLWADRAERTRVIDIPAAARSDLLRYEPPDEQLPRRMIQEDPSDYNAGQPEVDETEAATPDSASPQQSNDERRRLIWGVIQHGPSLDGPGAVVGEATTNVTPWPHQIRTYTRMYEEWPPRLLVADEVGLGKTVTIGLLLRQAWLSGRASRILVMAPKAVMRQWQLELREKFNLNWPIYDGQRLEWYPSPGLQQPVSRLVSREEWHREPFVITSSHLMRREDRARELLNEAEPYDLVVLDEAHHARRRGAGSAGATPNQLLRLMRALSERTPGLVLATATPMQVAPVEVFDLLSLLGVPDEWTDQAFVGFFERCAAENPTPESLDLLASMFRAVEERWGETSEEDARRLVPDERRLTTRKILKALRDEAGTPRRRLETAERRAAISIMRSNTIVSRLVARHTRELLRRYQRDGLLEINIAQRDVRDEFVLLSDEEADVYEAVEDYISSTYQQASANERSAVGFIMTVYRRRMASSFAALERTLERRLEKLTSGNGGAILEEDLPEDELEEESTNADEMDDLERQAALIEERASLADLLQATRRLPTDSKATELLRHIEALRRDGYQQVMVFSQYTDTLDFLRDHLTTETDLKVLCFTGRGGEQRAGGAWHAISRDEVKRLFREGSAEVLLCTDAAGEGLNFQFCGALINYDMPWNPMKVEQRIGRIDRLGQRFQEVRVINMHYRDTVEADIYIALRERIDLFGQFVGKLQPILSRLPGTIRDATLAGRGDWERRREGLVSELGDDIAEAEASPFDLDALESPTGLEIAPRVEPLYDLDALDMILSHPELLPPGCDVRHLGNHEYAWSQPGMSHSTRVTTDPTYFDEHPESVELWSPGNPTFPQLDDALPTSALVEVPNGLASAFRHALQVPSE